MTAVDDLPVLPDTDPVFSLLVTLASCLCQQFEIEGLPEHCFCGVLPGEQVALDYAGYECKDVCGMAWVRMSTGYPSAALGVPDESPRNCSATLGFEIEVGSMRCVPGVKSDGSPPSMAEMLYSTQLQALDMNAMRRAIACCPGNKDFIVGPYQPVGPDGGLVGGFWTIAVQVF